MGKLDDSLKIDIVDDVKPSGGTDLLTEELPFDSDDENLPDGMIPSFIAKPPPTDEIFDEDEPSVSLHGIPTEPIEEKPPPQVKVVPEPEPEPEPKPIGQKPVKLTKKGKPRKPMSEEHKAKLAKSREKAMARKKYLAEQRAITKSQEKEIKEKEFKLKQSVNKKKLDELNSQIPPTEASPRSPTPPPQPKPEKTETSSSNAITMKDLEEMSMKTLITMEKLRKDRKAAKKKAQQEAAYQQEVMETIKQANPSWIVDGSPFNNCF